MRSIPIEKDEFIGKKVTINACTDPTLEHLTGIIVDETKQTFFFRVAGSIKQVAKSTATFTIQEHDQLKTVNGSTLSFRPEDRIKKAR